METCGDCGHHPDGIFPSAIGNMLRNLFGFRMAKPTCGTYDYGAFYDREYCHCANMVHAMAVAPGVGREAYTEVS